MDAAVSICIAKRLSLKLPGDIFDSTSPASMDALMFRLQMERMVAADLPVFAIQGNHDRTDPPWFCALSPHVQYVDGKVFEAAPGMRIMGFDYRAAGPLREILGTVPPDVSIVMLHQAARQIMDIPGAWNLDPDWAPEWVTDILIGDIHKPVDFSWRKGAKGRYPGSAHMLSIDEPWEKFMLEEHMVDGKLVTTRVPLPSRRYVRTSVRTDDELFEAGKLIREAGFEDEVAPVILIEHAGVKGVPKYVSEAVEARRASGIKQPLCCAWPIPAGGVRVEQAPSRDIVADADVPTVLAQCTANGDMHMFIMDLLKNNAPAEVIRGLRTKMLGDKL